MPKIKTKKVVAKRFKITKKGKIIGRRQMSRHLKIKKTKARIRRQKEPKAIKQQLAKKIARLIPYA